MALKREILEILEILPKSGQKTEDSKDFTFQGQGAEFIDSSILATLAPFCQMDARIEDLITLGA